MAGLNTQGAYFDNVASTAAASAGVSPGHWRVYTKTDGVFAIDSTSAEYKLNSLPEAMAYTDAASGALQTQINAFTGGVTGMTSYTNTTPVEVPLGGIKAGDTFNGASIQYMFDHLLYPYQAPSFSSFSINQSSPLEVGATIPANRTFNWGLNNNGNIQGNTIAISDLTTLTSIATGLSGTSYVSAIASISAATATTHTWGITATPTQGSNISRSTSVSWQWRRFNGTSLSGSGLVSSDINALASSALSSTFAGVYSFVAGGYKVIAYPTSFGLANTFTDQLTNFNVAMQAPYTVAVTNANNITTNYYVYETTNILGSSINIVVA